MGLKSMLAKPFALYIARQIKKWSYSAIQDQERIFRNLMKKGSQTAFGKDHGLSPTLSYEAFKEKVPLRDYEGLKDYIERIKNGESSVLWPGKPKYFAKTSGTTSGVKYIPLTKDSMPNLFNSARNALFNYFAKTGNGRFLDGKMIFLSGSPELHDVSGIPTGRLSGIVNHEVPAWLRTNQLPSYPTNCIEAWEKKLEKVVEETLKEDMRLISGIPPWVQMYYESLLQESGKEKVIDLFPNYSVFVYGGVNFEPYRAALEKLVGKRIDSVETYPASEGFIAFQDSWPQEGLLLNTNSGIFFEFVPAEEIFEENPERLQLSEVEVGVNYALLINSNAGLWAYNIGDTVEFISLNPYRLRVTGRIKHFISAFGEHVIGKEVEKAMLQASQELDLAVVEFTVAPQVSPPEGGLPYHEWFVEFESVPENLPAIAARIDQLMIEQNIYYQDLIDGSILRPLAIRPLKPGAFRAYMKSQGKLGGQNKVPRLANDRKIAGFLEEWKLVPG